MLLFRPTMLVCVLSRLLLVDANENTTTNVYTVTSDQNKHFLVTDASLPTGFEHGTAMPVNKSIFKNKNRNDQSWNETITNNGQTQSHKFIEEPPFWTIVFDRVTACCTIIGFLANAVCFVILHRYSKDMASGISFLLRVQSFLDACCCFFSTILLLAPAMWKTGVLWLDYVICHLWHGQTIYWGFVGKIHHVKIKVYKK